MPESKQYLESQDSNLELMTKVIQFLVDYEKTNGEEFPNTSWSTTSLIPNYYISDPHELYYDWVEIYPNFFKWVSILANRRVNLRDIYHSVRRIRIFRQKIQQTSNTPTLEFTIQDIQDEADSWKEINTTKQMLYTIEVSMLQSIENKTDPCETCRFTEKVLGIKTEKCDCVRTA